MEAKKASVVFEEGDRVLVPEPASNGDVFYEAKVVTAEQENGEWEYLIHYQGWNKKWDEWLPGDRLIKDTAAARYAEKEKQREKTGRTASTDSKGGGKKGGEGKRRKRDKDDEARYSRDDGRPLLLHVSFPASLKKVLVADWERVTKEGEVLQLPHKHPVKTILEAHVEAYEQKADREIVGAIVDSFRQYFDQALPQVLLYQQEVAQSKRLLKHDKPASEVYGPEHLLRLLVKMPELLPYDNFDLTEGKVKNLEKRIAAIISFLQEHESDLFLDKYETQA